MQPARDRDPAPDAVRSQGFDGTIRTLVPMAADRKGPSRTCVNLAGGIATAGGKIEVMVNRIRGETSDARLLSVLPGPLAALPYKPLSGPASRALEAWFLRRLRPGDAAWLWPAASLDIHEKVARQGNPIILEGINSRMAQAKDILDAAYDAFGIAPTHGITPERIAEEDAKIALADTIFAPNSLVEKGLVGTPLDGRFIPTSYGVNTRQAPPPPTRTRSTKPGDPVIYMFCGFACVRKGVHYLLDIWPNMPANATLQLVGDVEGVIAKRYADLLASDRVEVVGFTDAVDQYYANADVFVFPSLEEGGPQVCYEAAHHALPSVTSDVGGGRIAPAYGTAHIVDPSDLEAFEAAMMLLYNEPDRRIAEGADAKKVAPVYDWKRVGADRYARLSAFLAAA